MREDTTESEVIITVSSSQVIKMLRDTTYVGSLEHSQSFLIYQLPDSLVHQTGGNLLVEFTPCLGDAEFKFIESPAHPNKFITVSNQIVKQQHGKSFHFIPLPRSGTIYILVRQPNVVTSENDN